MEKINYQILKKNIPSIKLVSLTDHYYYDDANNLIPWKYYYDDDGNIVPWTGDVDPSIHVYNMEPAVNSIVYNTNTGTTLIQAYYLWTGQNWYLITGSTQAEINKVVFKNHQIPILLENTIDNLGVMVGFDGNIDQIEQKCNFTYSGSSYTLIIYNTVNTNKLGTLIDSIFTIDWGDSSPTTTLEMAKNSDINLPYAVHTYLSGGTYNVKVTVESPWGISDAKSDIVVPIVNSYGFPTDLGTLIFNIPYSETGATQYQSYLMDYPSTTGQTEETGIYFRAVGASRVDELKKYGSENSYSGLTIISGYTGYTLDGLYYIDTPDGDTIITGSTETFYNEEVYNGMITRNEHFIGFCDEPIIFSDIFVERGKMGVIEKNFRLGEIDSVGELEIYGNGYFNVRKL